MLDTTLRALQGHPVIIATADADWSPWSTPLRWSIRSELQALGGVLLVRSDGVVWTLGPRDATACRRGDDLRELDEETGHAELVVLDPSGSTRFSRSRSHRAQLDAAILAALRTARRYVDLGAKLPSNISHEAWLMATLVASFAAVFRGGAWEAYESMLALVN
jgi:hypothetical protein